MEQSNFSHRSLDRLADIAIDNSINEVRPNNYYLTRLANYHGIKSNYPEYTGHHDLEEESDFDWLDVFKFHHKKILISISLFLAIILLVWIFGAIFVAKISLGPSRLSINAPNSSIISSLNSLDNSYKLTIKSSDGLSKSYKLADIGLSIDNQKTIKTIHKKKLSPLTYLTWWRVVPISVGLTENTQKLNSFISLSINTTAIQATDANLSLVNGAVVLAAGSNGKSYSLDNATATVLKHVGSLSAQPIMVTAKTITPRISSTQLKTAVDSINATIEQPVSIIIAGHTITPSSSDIFAWLQIVPNNLKNNVIVKVDSSKILSYLNSVSAKYNYAPRTQTVVARSDGSTSVLAAGADGLKVTDNTAAATQIAQNLLNDKGIKFTLATAVVPFSSVDATTYPKWIEVNLTDKKLYAYEQNNLVKTFLVSAGAPATPTVTGQYKIYSKVATQDMWGYNANGTMYNQPNVQWINYFYGSYAIHGNYWRPLSWFGSVNSSHGCVGLTNDDAEWIYDWAPIGTVVVTHY